MGLEFKNNISDGKGLGDVAMATKFVEKRAKIIQNRR